MYSLKRPSVWRVDSPVRCNPVGRTIIAQLEAYGITVLLDECGVSPTSSRELYRAAAFTAVAEGKPLVANQFLGIFDRILPLRQRVVALLGPYPGVLASALEEFDRTFSVSHTREGIRRTQFEFDPQRTLLDRARFFQDTGREEAARRLRAQTYPQ